MESVTVYLGGGDLDKIHVQLVMLTAAVLIVGILAVRALEGIRDAIRGRDLAELKAEAERLRAEGKYTREDLEEAFEAGGRHHTEEGEPSFEEWMAGDGES